MKKILTFLIAFFLLIGIGPIDYTQAKTSATKAAVKKTVKRKVVKKKVVRKKITKKTVVKKVTPVKGKVIWTAAAIKYSKKIPPQIRKAVIVKITNYARKKGLKTVTPKVMDDMRE